MSVLKCHHTAIGGVYYLAADFSVVCYDSRHWMMILVAVSIGSVFCVGVPLFMVWMLRKNKEHLSDPAFFSRFGFLIDGYRPDTSWYEHGVAYCAKRHATRDVLAVIPVIAGVTPLRGVQVGVCGDASEAGGADRGGGGRGPVHAGGLHHAVAGEWCP